MTPRSRWDETRSLIEAGWHSGWYPEGMTGNEKRAMNCPVSIDWDDIKRADMDAERQIYGGMFTPQRED